jgi:iron complex transport system substrate-binding protein
MRWKTWRNNFTLNDAANVTELFMPACEPPDVARRIVCIAPSNTEILYALGAADRIVGVSTFCDFPPESAQHPRCGGFFNPNIERILALRPDLVLAQSFLQEDAVKALVHAEVRVMAFAATSVREILDDVILLGRMVSREEQALAIVRQMTEELEKVRQRAGDLSLKLGRKPRVHLEEWGPKEPYYLAGDWVAELLSLAGGENCFSDRPLRCPSPQRQISDTDIAQRDPDLIITAWCGCNEKVDLSRVARRPALQDSRAVRQGWLRAVDDRFLMRPGPRITEGARRLQAHIEEWSQAQMGHPSQ